MYTEDNWITDIECFLKVNKPGSGKTQFYVGGDSLVGSVPTYRAIESWLVDFRVLYIYIYTVYK